MVSAVMAWHLPSLMAGPLALKPKGHLGRSGHISRLEDEAFPHPYARTRGFGLILQPSLHAPQALSCPSDAPVAVIKVLAGITDSDILIESSEVFRHEL